VDYAYPNWVEKSIQHFRLVIVTAKKGKSRCTVLRDVYGPVLHVSERQLYPGKAVGVLRQLTFR
jgi:hypothetical protein